MHHSEFDLKRSAPLLLALVAGACGGSGNTPDPGPIDPIVVDPRLGVPDEGYQAPPPPCAQENLAEYPALPLMWNSGFEMFLGTSEMPEALAVDYDVWPAPSTNAVSVSLEFDRTVAIEPVRVSGDCTPSIPFSMFDTPGVDDDVISARVAAEEAGARNDRWADVFFARGTTSITLRTEGLEAGDPVNGEWFFAYEPAHGEPRIALVAATLDRATLTIDGLPSGPALVSLIQTPSLEVDDSFDVIYGPPAFAADYMNYSRGWYGAVSIDRAGEPLVLQALVPPDVQPQLRLLGQEVVFASAPVLISVPPTTGTSAVQAPCGQRTRLSVAGFATASVRLGEASVELGPGEATVVPGTCAPGSASATFSVTARSLNGRDVQLVLVAEVD